MQALPKGVDDIEGHPPRHFWINGANIHIIDFQLTLWSCTEFHWVPCLALCSWPWYMPRHPLQISSMLEQWLLLPRRTMQKLRMQDEKIKNDATTLGQALSCMPHCLFHLKATLIRFLAFIATLVHHIVSSMQGSQSLERLRERRGPEGGEGAQCCKVPQCRFISPF